MSNKFINTVTDYAEKLEITLTQENDHFFSFLFNMGEGRSQKVVIYHHEREKDKSDIVEIASAVLKIDELPDKKIGQDMAMKLLRENDSSLGAKWAVDANDESSHLVAMANWFLDDMDLEEFEMSVYSVAGMADALESQLGVDHF